MNNIKTTSLVLFVVLTNNLFGQDLIWMRTGDKIEAKVVEITPEVVKYKKFSNMDGPSYSVDKNKVLQIAYKNGEVEKFQITSVKSELQASTLHKLDIKGYNFYYPGTKKRVPEPDLKKMMTSSSKNIEGLNAYKNALSLKKKSKLIPFAAIPLGITSLFSLALYSDEEGFIVQFPTISLVSLAGAGAAVYASIRLNKLSKKKKVEAVEFYNGIFD